jgi:site-specific recombinase XerD
MPDDHDRFDSLVEAWLDSHGSRNTRLAYRSDLAVFRSWWIEHRRRTPLTTTRNDVERFEQACFDAGASGATVARRVSALSSFFNFAVGRGVVAASPVSGRRRPHTTASQTVDLDARQLAAVIRSSAGLGNREAVLVGLLLFDGLKLAEVLAADADDITFTSEGSELRVLRRGTRRQYPLDPRTTTALIGHLAGREAGPLLYGESPARPPSRLTRFGADYVLKRISADAGVAPPISANTLRRSFVSNAYATGTSIESIRDQLGHTDTRTTRRHLTADP